MDKVIVTALLTMAAVVAAVMVVNSLIPVVGRGSSALVSSSETAAQRIKADIDIIHVASDASANEVFVWIKNVGSAEIVAIDRSDLFLRTASAYDRLPYGAGPEYWDYIIEGGETTWRPAATSKITIHLSSLPSGEYLVRFLTYNGVVAEKPFSV